MEWGLDKEFTKIPDEGYYLKKVTSEGDLPKNNNYADDPNNKLNNISLQDTVDDYYRVGLEQVLGTLQVCKVKVLPFGLIHDGRAKSKREQLPELLQPDSLDNTNRAILGELVECLLFDVLPPLRGGKSLIVSIDAATRTFVDNDGVLGGAMADWEKSYGITITVPNGFRSLAQDDFYPIVAEALGRRRNSLVKLEICGARAAQLYDFAKMAADRQEKGMEYVRVKINKYVDKWRRPKQRHYLADWVVRAIREQLGSTNRQLSVLTQPGDFGFRQHRNDSFRSWLKAGRAADRGDFGSAVAESIKAWNWLWSGDRELEKHWGLARWLLPQSAFWFQNLSGSDFLRIRDELVRSRKS